MASEVTTTPRSNRSSSTSRKLPGGLRYLDNRGSLSMLRAHEASRESGQRGCLPVCLSQSGLFLPRQAASRGRQTVGGPAHGEGEEHSVTTLWVLSHDVQRAARHGAGRGPAVGGRGGKDRGTLAGGLRHP